MCLTNSHEISMNDGGIPVIPPDGIIAVHSMWVSIEERLETWHKMLWGLAFKPGLWFIYLVNKIKSIDIRKPNPNFVL